VAGLSAVADRQPIQVAMCESTADVPPEILHTVQQRLEETARTLSQMEPREPSLDLAARERPELRGAGLEVQGRRGGRQAGAHRRGARIIRVVFRIALAIKTVTKEFLRKQPAPGIDCSHWQTDHVWTLVDGMKRQVADENRRWEDFLRTKHPKCGPSPED